MKKSLALLLVLVLLFTFAACEKKSAEETEEPEETEEEETEESQEETEESQEESQEETLEVKQWENDQPDVQVPQVPAYVGAWRYNMELGDFAKASFLEELEEFDFPISNLSMIIHFELTFSEQGDFSVHVSMEEEDFNSFIQELTNMAIEMVYAQAEKEGYSKQDYARMVEEEIGLTLEAYVKALLESELSYDMITESMGEAMASGTYEEVDGVLVTTTPDDEDGPVYIQYEIQDGNLVVLDMYNIIDGEKTSALEELKDYPSLQMPWVMEKISLAETT